LLLRRYYRFGNTVEDLEEGSDDEDDVVAPTTLTLRRMSLAFSRIKERLDVIAYTRICSQEYASVYSRVVCIAVHVIGGEERLRKVTHLVLNFLVVKLGPLNVVSHNLAVYKNLTTKLNEDSLLFCVLQAYRC
jgi:hypothetical protein